MSLTGQVDNYSLDAQKDKLDALARKYDLSIAHLIDDAGYSGADFSRPSIQKILTLLRSGKINAVVFPYLDRFARNVEGGLALVRQYRDAGARVFLGELGECTDERAVKTQMVLGLLFAEMQKDDIAEKSRSCVTHKVGRGEAHGGRSPYGWRFVTKAELTAEAIAAGLEAPKRPGNMHRRVPEQITTVQLIYQLASEGISLRGICRELQARGIRGPLKPRWNAYTVRRILQDECYHTGIWWYGKRIGVEPQTIRSKGERHRVRTTRKLRDRSEWIGQQTLDGGPAVSKELYDAAKAALEGNAKGRAGRPSTTGDVNLLRSLLRCQECGSCVTLHQTKRKHSVYRTYICDKRDRVTGAHLCSCREHVRAELLEEAVFNEVCESLTTQLDAKVREYRALIASTSSGEAGELKKAEQQKAKLEKRMVEAAELRLMEDNETLKRTYAKMVADTKQELAAVVARIQGLQMDTGRGVIQVDEQSIRRKVEAARKTKDRAEKHEFLREAVEEVRYARGEAVVTLRVPLRALSNCKLQVRAANNFISLKTKVSVAA